MGGLTQGAPGAANLGVRSVPIGRALWIRRSPRRSSSPVSCRHRDQPPNLTRAGHPQGVEARSRHGFEHPRRDWNGTLREARPRRAKNKVGTVRFELTTPAPKASRTTSRQFTADRGSALGSDFPGDQVPSVSPLILAVPAASVSPACHGKRAERAPAFRRLTQVRARMFQVRPGRERPLGRAGPQVSPRRRQPVERLLDAARRSTPLDSGTSRGGSLGARVQPRHGTQRAPRSQDPRRGGRG